MRVALPLLVAALCVCVNSAVFSQGLRKAAEEGGVESGEGGQHLREWGNGGAKGPEDDEVEQEDAEEATTEEATDEATTQEATTEEATTVAVEDGRTRVDLFYETECPDCMKTIYEELRVVWADEVLRDRINLVLHPFGNALVIPTTELSEGYSYWHDVKDRENIFVCQHGESECRGNLIQACVMHMKEDDPVRFLPFIFCMEGKTRDGVEKKSYECGEELGIDMEEVKTCVEGPEGERLMTKIGLHTMSQKINHVPWIHINGNHIESAEDGEFLRTLCGVWGEDQPAACKTAPRKPPEEEPAPQQSRGGGQPMLLVQTCDASTHPFPVA